jgi:hypothetical protein
VAQGLQGVVLPCQESTGYLSDSQKECSWVGAKIVAQEAGHLCRLQVQEEEFPTLTLSLLGKLLKTQPS